MPVHVVSLRRVSKRYRHFLLDAVDLEVPQGRIVGLVGANGSGKSTLFRILLGLLRPDSGDVEVFGLRLPEAQVEAKQWTGFVSEDMRLHPRATLAWHAKLVRSFHPRWDDERARLLMDRFALLPGQKAGELSRGQTLKAMLVLALAHHPRLLLLDEATAGLDPLTRRGVLAELRRLADMEGLTILFSSHLDQDVETLADETAFMEGGRLRQSPRALEAVR